MLNEEQMNGIKDGIKEGFKNHDIDLTEREKLVMDLTLKTTLDVLNKIAES